MGFNSAFKGLIQGHRLMTFENGVLRTIFAPNGDEVTGGMRKFHSEELHYPYP